MRLQVVDHPLVAHKLTVLRDERTESPTFRLLADELVTLLAYEATRDARVAPLRVTTPVGPADGVKLSAPKPLVVPILRAGLGMLDGMARLLPTAEIGFLGMIRDELTLQATTYATRLPDDLTGRQCYLLDPMLATGGTLGDTITFEAQLYADGRIQFNYLDLVSGTAVGNNGASATVGVKATGTQGPSRLLLAFNNGPNAFVGSGLSTLLTLPPPTSDYYALSLDAGDMVMLAAKGQAPGNLTVELRNSNDTVPLCAAISRCPVS